MTADPLRPPPPPRTRVPPLILLVVVTAVLYFGRDLLIPLALAILLSFLLAPAVTRLERWHFGRIPATIVVVVCSFSAIGLIGWVAGNQLIGLANSLPEYRYNIRTKIESLRGTPTGSIGRAAAAIRELGEELGLSQPAAPAAGAPGTPGRLGPTGRGPQAAPAPPPVPVQIQPGPAHPLELIGEVVSPVLAPLGTAGAVVLFTVLMLLQREDLRDRLIRLIGQGQINVTTQAMEEAAHRVSRFLRMQLIINVSYGVPVGIALHFLGLPNAALWGLLATVLRFVPYVGPWVAAAFPVALAFAISDGWSLMLWTVSVFVVLEVISNNVLEPWLYGASTGLSAFAIIVSALFWTWLWGAVGLLLATPLTVCVAVMGRYIPQLAFLDVMLGDEPVLAPHARFYQRLLAGDEEEATEIAETYLSEHSLPDLYEEVIIPALGLAEQDRHREALDDRHERHVFDGTRRIVEMLTERPDPDAQNGSGAPHAAAPLQPSPARPGVFVLSARDEADHIAGTMLAAVLASQPYDVRQLPQQILASEAIERVAQENPAIVCVSAMPPLAVMHAGYLCKRLRARFPGLKILVVLWNAEGDIEKARTRLLSSGMDRLVTTLRQADEQIRKLALPVAMALQAGADAAAAEAVRRGSAPAPPAASASTAASEPTCDPEPTHAAALVPPPG